MTAKLDALYERRAGLVAERDQAHARLAANSASVEHESRVQLFRANLSADPRKMVKGPVQTLLRSRDRAEDELRELDADIQAVETLIGEAEEAAKADAATRRDREFKALQKQAEASWQAVFDRFNGLHSDWTQLAADLGRVAEAWQGLPDRDRVSPFPHSVIPGDLMMLCQVLVDHGVRRGHGVMVPWFEASMDELPEVRVSVPGGFDVRYKT